MNNEEEDRSYLFEAKTDVGWVTYGIFGHLLNQISSLRKIRGRN